MVMVDTMGFFCCVDCFKNVISRLANIITGVLMLQGALVEILE